MRLQRFKRILDAHFDLRTVNVLVGGNNAGKSSIIQGLHFGIGLFQSIALADKSLNATSSAPLSTSLNPNQLVYSPSDDLYALGPGGRLPEALEQAVSLELTLDTGETCSVSPDTIAVIAAPIYRRRRLARNLCGHPRPHKDGLE